MNFGEFEKFYTSLTERFEGYIQLSDSKEFIVLNGEVLPQWQEIHHGKNFINEICLFDGDRSITIRQINDGFGILDKRISNYKEVSYINFLANSKIQCFGINEIRIAQIWLAQSDKLCCNFDVLEPKFLLFSGFSRGDSK